MKPQLYFKRFLLLCIAITPIALLMLPANLFDNGRSICLSQLLLGKNCYACGMTRGIMHLIHLDFEEAFAYNMLSFIVLPLLAFLWVQWFIKEYRIYKLLKSTILLNERKSIN